MSVQNLKQIRLEAHPSPPSSPRPQRFIRHFIGSVLSPTYWLLAHAYQTPGLRLHRKWSWWGLELLFKRQPDLSRRWLYFLIFFPFDSTRYFEFDFAWRELAGQPMTRYLDVSSPRLFPLLVLRERPELVGDLLNPDPADLALTSDLAKACELDKRAQLHNCLIQDAPFAPASFDAITSLSVIEHIPQNRPAIEQLWEWLKPGGRLVLSVPCAAQAEALYVNTDHYHLLPTDTQGYVFLEYVYDQALLEENILSVTGPPQRARIYGEKRPGFLRQVLLHRWSGKRYPYWREAWMMGREFRYFEKIAELPGEGVIALEFVKP